MRFDPETTPLIPCAICKRPMPMRPGDAQHDTCSFTIRPPDGDLDSGARSSAGAGVLLRDMVLASIGAALIAAALSASITRNVAIAEASGHRHVAPAGSAASVGRRIVFHVESGR